MKRLLLSVCIPALTFFGFSLKAHAAETHSAPAFRPGRFGCVCCAKVLERDKRGIGLGGWSCIRFISESGYIIPSK